MFIGLPMGHFRAEHEGKKALPNSTLVIPNRIAHDFTAYHNVPVHERLGCPTQRIHHYVSGLGMVRLGRWIPDRILRIRPASIGRSGMSRRTGSRSEMRIGGRPICASVKSALSPNHRYLQSGLAVTTRASPTGRLSKLSPGWRR